MKWLYGDHAKNYDMTGEIKVGLGTVKVHDIFDPLPDFMKEADYIFVDPPYNEGLLKGFYTKAGLGTPKGDFERFTARFFECIKEIGPEYLYVEIGKQNVAMYESICSKMFQHVEITNCIYYKDPKNICYILRCTNSEPTPNPLTDGMDESDAIETICSAVPEGKVIGDLCMGMGLVGISAQKHGRRFVGTELNVHRLAKMVHIIRGR